MKKRLAIVLSCCLLLSGGWAWPATTAHGAMAKVEFSINNEALILPVDSTPYVSGSTVMVPLRIAGEALDLTVSFIKKNNIVLLAGGGSELSLKVGGSEVTINGQDTIAFEGKVVLRNNRIYVPLTFFYALGLVTTYDAVSGEVAVNTTQAMANTVLGLFTSGKYELLSQRYFSKVMQTAVSVPQLQQAWESIATPNGDFVKLKSVQASKGNDGLTIVSTVSFSKGDVAVTSLVNNNGQIIGLHISPVPADLVIPASVVEEEINVGAGTTHPLKGTLTLPKNATGPLSAVVLVQGSGASDQDETAFGYKPFRDIAWGLAQQGIAVLRYDKRTFTYPQQFMGEAATGVTVKEETVDDAIAASLLLKSDKRINPARVYMVGHSLGGMLAPRIDAEGGDFAGLILLAGSPRKLWEIMNDQYAAIFKAMDDKDPLKAQSQAMLAAEMVKANQMSTWSETEAKATTLFGSPAYYFMEMDQHNTETLARKLTKPVLVLQGSDDIQVYANKDYPLWQEVLKNDPLAVYKLYPGLNHFFVNYDGVGAGTATEYNVAGLVDAKVISDMAEWITGQK
ncbi:alpha/beta fold hydrolase [Paenibacillus sp. 19GGS1-52]|uniref:alpha/beta fold hydrolase n=1 Tax=Paenibacillus sp. 19GGS1-52 TaxID=2758563 RepID=UPI001EFB5038|nr:alpha/beta fold hydrolase [Paenibacillus sp. 19GGS1-52]ULO05177.1 alpha/beta fold hydrolase [Paenibacillus sp. 19GGS1-52]